MAKRWYKSKTDLLAVVIAISTAVVGGITAAVGTIQIPSELILVVGVIGSLVLPILRKISTEPIVGRITSPVLMILLIIFIGGIGAYVAGRQISEGTKSVSAVMFDADIDAVDSDAADIQEGEENQ